MSHGPRDQSWRRLFRLPPSIQRIQGDIDAELRFHLDNRIDELISAGHAPAEANRIARQQYGDITASRDELAEVDRRTVARRRRADWLDVIRQDVSYAWRGLRRQPAFTIGVALTIALAVGANGAVFSLIDPLLFRAPPGVTEPGTVVRLYANSPKALRAVNGRAVSQYFSYSTYAALRASLNGRATIAAYRGPWDSSVVKRGSDSLFANVTYATSDYLPLLGVRAARGRFFTEVEDDIDAPASVCVISTAFARRMFGDAEALGQSLHVRGAQCAIIGIAGGGFQGISSSATAIWAPFSGQPRLGDTRKVPWYRLGDVYIPIVARLAPGVDRREVAARATVAIARSVDHPRPTDEGKTALLGPILEERGPLKQQQETTIGSRLAVVAGIVLLIACANVANLYLVRAIRRRRETAVRLALGISRRRLALQFVVEGLLLACIAAAAALVIAGWGGAALRLALLPRVQWSDAPLGPRVVFFSVACALAASLVASIVPAILASRPQIVEALNAGARNGVARRSVLRSVLLASQAGLSLILVVGAALFVQSLRNVRSIDLGVDADRLVVASAFFPDAKAHIERKVLIPEVAARMTAVPGVKAATYATGGPLHSWYSGVPLFQPGRDSAITTERQLTDFIGVAPNYFDATGTRIAAGRGFLQWDRRDAAPVMVIGATLAEVLWPGESPLGKCVIPTGPTNPCFTIVGVARDVHQLRIIETPALHFYVPLEQAPFGSSPNTVFVNAEDAAQARVAATLRAELTRAFPDARISARPAAAIIAPQLRPWRLGAQLFGALGLLSLLVAAVGVYSVVSFAAQQRVHEMGVRIALGARTTHLPRLVAGNATAVVAAGVAAGLIGALFAGKFVASLLYGISPRDPGAAVVAALALVAVACIASAGPAWRASRLDPLMILRDE